MRDELESLFAVELESLFAVLEHDRAGAVTACPVGNSTPLGRCLNGAWPSDMAWSKALATISAWVGQLAFLGRWAPVYSSVTCEPTYFLASTDSSQVGFYSTYSNGGAPPPSAAGAFGPTSSASFFQSKPSPPVLVEAPAVPEAARRWVEESKAWVALKQRQGRYQGRNGYEALRLLRKCGEWVSCFPANVGEPELRTILARIGGTAPKTRRYYLSILASFLSSPPRMNDVVKHSGFKDAYKNRAVRTPVLPVAARDRILHAAQGPERVIVSFLCSARRPVEIFRARVEDLDLARGYMGVRTKGGRGDVTDRVPLNDTVLCELRWYLPLRESWAARASEDSGHLVCRWEGERLVGVSIAYLRRALEEAERRAEVARYPLYSFRRGAATLLRDRGAEWEDIRDTLTHRSIGTTEGYVKSLRAAERAPAVVRLLDAREART